MTAINSELIIDGNVLRTNISYIKNKLENKSKFMAVIKSDAYGHNLEEVTGDIDDLADGYGVVRIDEARKIMQVFFLHDIEKQKDRIKIIPLEAENVSLCWFKNSE